MQLFVTFCVISIVASIILTSRTLADSKYLVLNSGYSARRLIKLRQNIPDSKNDNVANLESKSTLERSPTTNPSKRNNSFEEQDTRLGFRKLVLQKQKEVGESEKQVVLS